MRARALAECLGFEAVVSVRGGGAAREAARLVGAVVDRPSLSDIDLLILDDPSAEHGAPWIARAANAGVRSVSVHDEGWSHPADLVVCGRLGAALKNRAATVLNGPRFYLLDRRIAQARDRRTARRPSRPRVIVALGGGDHVRRGAQALADALASHCPGVDVAVAAGLSSRPQPPLRHATWLSARGGLVDALTAADVAVVAGGVTLYEACALGVPAVGLAVVAEQRPAVRAFARARAILDAGGVASSARAIDRAALSVARLLSDDVLRARTSAEARRLVDGRGAERVARYVRALVGETSGIGTVSRG
jgi:spore coat polysaccharide biosynthesis predicted glycosyltransferase SpsG